MKLRFILALLATAAVPPAMMAADQSVSISATVPKYCQYNGSGFFETMPNTTPVSSVPGTSTIKITNPTDPKGFMQNWGFTFKVNGTCNHVSNLEITTKNGGLTTTTGPVPGFINRFDYNASGSFDGAGPATIPTTNGTPGASSISPPHPTTGPHVGQVILLVTGLPDTSLPVLGGSYTDTLTITLTPQ